MISIVILTLNEELNLPGCLESVKWSDDIVVYDSFSSDRTVEIARAAGVRVVQRKFDNYAAQRNAALSEVQYKYNWVLMVDADERWPESIFKEIDEALGQGDGNITIYNFLRYDMFLGRWLKRSNGYPTWVGRLMKIGRVTINREINEEYHTDGKNGYLKTHFVHYPFNKGIAYWFERHNRYSTMEAQALVEEVRAEMDWRGLCSSVPNIRRKALKQLAYRIPGRPFLVFVYLTVFRLGFLDGVPGLTYATLRMFYEFMIDLKVKELRRKQKGLSCIKKCRRPKGL